MNAQEIINTIASEWAENWDVIVDALGQETAKQIEEQAFKESK